MKNIGLVLVCCLSTVAQAEYRMLMPLEVKNNGRLPDGSILFSGANGPTTPLEPVEEATDCTVDIAAGTYYLVQEEVGETLIIKAYNGQRISNGIKGKLLDGSFETYGLLVYELCMNGQLPQTYVEPAETWANGECKYNTLGEAPQRYWTEVNNGNTQGEKVFQNASLGGSGYVSFYDNPQMSFFNFGVLYNYGRKVNSNSRFVYNGYTYYKGKYIYSIVNGYSYSDNYGGAKFTSPIDYYEVCRTQ